MPYVKSLNDKFCWYTAFLPFMFLALIDSFFVMWLVEDKDSGIRLLFDIKDIY